MKKKADNKKAKIQVRDLKPVKNPKAGLKYNIKSYKIQ